MNHAGKPTRKGDSRYQPNGSLSEIGDQQRPIGKSKVESSILGFLVGRMPAEFRFSEANRVTSPQDFDIPAFFAAIDARRHAEHLTWLALTKTIWEQSRVLNERRKDHPISPATVRNLGERGDVSCQHALFLLRWLDVPPETFIAEPQPGTAGIPLPLADDAHRLRWNLSKLYRTLNAARTSRGATWHQAAKHLHCTANQLTNLRIAKFATGMRLAMRITQALRRPAANFIDVAEW